MTKHILGDTTVTRYVKPIRVGSIGGHDVAVYKVSRGWVGLMVNEWYGDGNCSYSIVITPDGSHRYLATNMPVFPTREAAELALAEWALTGEYPGGLTEKD